MNHRQRKFFTKPSAKLSILIVAAILASVLFSYVQFRVPAFIMQSAFFSLQPIAFLKNKGGAMVQFLQRHATLVKENEYLKNENALFSLKLLQQTPSDSCASAKTPRAKVLFSPQSLFHDRILIDKGENDAIIAGELATVSKTILIGVVEKTTARSSEIRLAWSYGNTIGATIERLRLSFFLEGVGANVLRFRAPRDIEILVGDLVHTTDTPRLIIGLVDSVDRNDVGAFQTVFVKTPINIYTTSSVDIIAL